MLDPLQFLRALRSHDVAFFAGVPDSLLQGFCACLLEHTAAGEHLIAANEGGAVAAAIGYHLATGRTPLVYMQNSGLPNALNPLLSLADPAVYGMPMLLMIGWRGEPGVRDEPQHVKTGAATLPLLEASQIEYTVIDSTITESDVVAREAVRSVAGRPYALVVRKGAFEKYPAGVAAQRRGAFTREEAIELVASALDGGDLVVATTGMTARELDAYRQRRGQSHDRDFLVIGGMGHAAQIAHTLASYRRDRRVYCLDGDGAVLMHMGALAVIGATRPPNLRHVVLNNGVHESVGGQPTVGLDIDLVGVARAVGYPVAVRVAAAADMPEALAQLRGMEGPVFLEIRVATGHRSDLGRPAALPAQRKEAWLTALSS